MTKDRTKSLAELYPAELKRVRVVLSHYVEIGPAGTFGAAMIRQYLAAAETALANQDVVGMIRAYEDLKSIFDPKGEC